MGGYIPSNLGLDSLVIGFYRGKDLIYAGRVRAGFVPAMPSPSELSTPL